MENKDPSRCTRGSGGNGSGHDDLPPRIPESGCARNDPVDSGVYPRENEGENRQEGAAGNPLANPASEV